MYNGDGTTATSQVPRRSLGCSREDDMTPAISYLNVKRESSMSIQHTICKSGWDTGYCNSDRQCRFDRLSAKLFSDADYDLSAATDFNHNHCGFPDV